MKTVQELYALQKLMPNHLHLFADRSKPFFSVSVRTDGPWVGFVETNHFMAAVNGLALVTGLLEGSGPYHLTVERLEQDKDDSCRYNTTVLHSIAL